MCIFATDMKQLLYILVVMGILTACESQHDKAVKTLLDSVSVVMEEHPERADTLLSSLEDSVTELSTPQRIQYYMLRAEASYKLDKQMPSDTVFQEVVDYYDRHGNANQRMKAYYLMGGIYRYRHEAPMALQWYLDATEQADTLSPDCDNWALMKVYGQMADLYHSQLMPLEEIAAHRQFSKYAEKAGNTYQAIRGIEKQLGAYQLMGDTAMILALTDSVHKLYTQADMPQAAASVYPTAIYIYLAKNDYPKAKELMDIFEQKSGLFDKEGNIEPHYELYNGAKGMYYQQIGKLDSASYFYYHLQRYGHKMYAYNGLFSVYWQEHDLDSVVKYSLLYRQSIKDNAEIQQQEAMVKVKALYDYSRNQKIARLKEIALIHRTNLIIYIIIGVAILLVLFSVWYIRNRHATKEALRKKKQLYISILNSTKATLATKEKELENLSQRNFSLEERERILRQEIADAKSRINVLEANTPFHELLPHNQEEEMLANPIVAKFHHFAMNTITIQQLMPDNWYELYQLIQYRLPRLYSLVENDSRLNTEQKRIVFLVRLKFKNNEIINLLGLQSPQMVTNRITKLNLLLYGKKSAKDFYNNLRNVLPKT